MEDKKQVEPVVEMNIIDHGPLIVTGKVKIITPDGKEIVRERCAICRCGGSSKQPYCDGTHAKKQYENKHETFF